MAGRRVQASRCGSTGDQKGFIQHMCPSSALEKMPTSWHVDSPDNKPLQIFSKNKMTSTRSTKACFPENDNTMPARILNRNEKRFLRPMKNRLICL
jgi:hypothetical protein